MTEHVIIRDLPGGERVERALQDIANGRESDAVAWIQMASGRARSSGLPVPDGPPDVHLELFRRCVEADPTSGHATYRALNEELASFLDALESRTRREARRTG